MHKNKRSGNEIVPQQQLIVCYHGNMVSLSIKSSHAYQRARQRLDNISLSITIDNHKRKLICRAPTKAQFILHALISQIPSFQNYEKVILAYVKSRETKDYLKNHSGIKIVQEKTGFLKSI